MAKKSKAPKVDRSAKLAELREIVAMLDEQIPELEHHGEQRDLLESVAEGLYEETDKLCKKAPAEQVTELLLEQVNQVVVETKELIKGDAYVQRMNQFVPAGDRPEHRDVVVILRMILQALKRFETYLAEETPEAQRKLNEAKVLEYVTDQYQEQGAVLTKGRLNHAFVKDAEGWFIGDDEAFDFDALVLPNHTEAEAVALAERLRASVSRAPLTSHALKVSVSVGVSVYPSHGQDLVALKSAADAAYDAKKLGRDLVRVFGEAAPASRSREPERKEANPEGLTAEQRRKIRQDYFRGGVARCPHDEAILGVEDVTSMGRATRSIYVSCPLCGLSEELD